MSGPRPLPSPEPVCVFGAALYVLCLVVAGVASAVLGVRVLDLLEYRKQARR